MVGPRGCPGLYERPDYLEDMMDKTMDSPAASQRVLDVIGGTCAVYVDGERVTRDDVVAMAGTLGWRDDWTRGATPTDWAVALLALLCERRHGDRLLAYDGTPERVAGGWTAWVYVTDGTDRLTRPAIGGDTWTCDGDRLHSVSCSDDDVETLAGEVAR